MLSLTVLYKKKYMCHNQTRFVGPGHKDYVYKLHKALYGLKQVPRAWYNHLKKFLLDDGFVRGVIDPKNPDKVFRLNKALYGLKQAPRAWYYAFKEFLLKKGFKPSSLDPTLFTKTYDDELFMCQIYVDDIIFGCTNQCYNDEFAYMMSEEYQMSRMGELKFFLGLQICQQHNGIFISQEKYLKDMLIKFGMQDCKGVKIPMPTNGHLCTNENG